MKNYPNVLLVALALGACNAPATPMAGGSINARLDTNGDGELDTTISRGRGRGAAICEGNCDEVSACDMEFCPPIGCDGEDCDDEIDEGGQSVDEICAGGDCGPCDGEYCENLECVGGGPIDDVDVVFDCDDVTVVSCKDLSNIVIELADGSRQRFEGLEGQRAVLSGGEIVRVWVKAGRNFSGDGPGYGERFDAPESCESDDGTGEVVMPMGDAGLLLPENDASFSEVPR